MAQAQLSSAAASEANPAPLGLAGIGLATFMLMLVDTVLVKDISLAIVVSLALADGGAGQVIAGWWDFKSGNTFGGVAFTSYMAHLGGEVLLVKFAAALVVGFLAWRLRGHPRALLWMGVVGWIGALSNFTGYT